MERHVGGREGRQKVKGQRQNGKTWVHGHFLGFFGLSMRAPHVGASCADVWMKETSPNRAATHALLNGSGTHLERHVGDEEVARTRHGLAQQRENVLRVFDDFLSFLEKGAGEPAHEHEQER